MPNLKTILNIPNLLIFVCEADNGICERLVKLAKDIEETKEF